MNEEMDRETIQRLIEENTTEELLQRLGFMCYDQLQNANVVVTAIEALRTKSMTEEQQSFLFEMADTYSKRVFTAIRDMKNIALTATGIYSTGTTVEDDPIIENS